jgi:hypothetical protein
MLICCGILGVCVQEIKVLIVEMVRVIVTGSVR